MAFLSVNHFSRAPLLGTSDLVPFTNEEFAEYISMYTGTPSPATSSFVGAPLRRGNNTNFHTTADAAGLNLAKAALWLFYLSQCSSHSSLTQSLADPLATIAPRTENPTPIMGVVAPSWWYRSCSRTFCIA